MALSSMQQFFDETDVSHFKFQNKDALFMDIKALGWTKNGLNMTYWRSCYSYILCSTIGAFEVAYNKRIDAQHNPKQQLLVNGMTMALTGVQGTGKSVLGSFIALFMAKVFGWRVTYHWGDLRHSFGPIMGGKEIGIMDYSTVNTYSNTDNFFFVLMVSSCNGERWHQQEQQETWANAGNLIFIDTVAEEEMLAMLENDTALRQDLIDNIKIVGGVPRLCSKPLNEIKMTIDAALDNLDFYESVRYLNNLKDLTDAHLGAGAQKVYPGLLVHTVPTNPFRNQFSLQFSSEYVQKVISMKIKKKQEGDIQILLKDLIAIPKARGLAGLIWEPLFTRKAKTGKGKLCISGCMLPISNPRDQMRILVDLPLKDLDVIEFTDMSNFQDNIPLLSLTNKAILAKAVHDNFTAIDGVLIFKSGQDCVVIAGLQMTTAKKEHSLKEHGIVHFADVANCVAKQCASQGLTQNCDKQLWFLQPEECLNDFGFSGLQALVFSAPRKPKIEALASTRSGRKRNRPERWGEFDTGMQKKQSNDPVYWPDKAKEIVQYIAVARFTGGAVGIEEKHAAAIAAKLNESEPTMGSAVFQVKDPRRRTWMSTVQAFKKLSQHAGVDSDFIDVMRKDIELDRCTLEQLGVQLDVLPRAKEEHAATDMDTTDMDT